MLRYTVKTQSKRAKNFTEVFSNLQTERGPLSAFLASLASHGNPTLELWIQEKYFFSIYLDQWNSYDKFFLFPKTQSDILK